MRGEFDAIVTAPVQKSVINDAGIAFTGHTEYLAARTGAALPVMLLATDELRVALATTHLPLKDVSAAHHASTRCARSLRILDADAAHALGHRTRRASRSAASTRTPARAGTSGDEEIDVIAPAIARMRARGMRR